MSREAEAGAGWSLVLLTIVFTVLRVANVIDWPWWAVVSPLLIGPALFLTVVGLFAVVAFLALVGLWIADWWSR